ncbi:nitrilase [Paraburkholderia sp. Tr-20389]|uniref:nitrilase-related carbon-nitrogen hydrolase n=1 Tax=Paraburkholderia sp. Tr-20389 TaxID=2703903 RepID=UPI00197EDFE0|nr:nitrilase-related carbon-nitrogen hydrolase [Paraburkholderia sp. Tr-20389]MBN3758095.1 nitrilase [Paraburkholderia sp. Tr-20389]
MFSLPAAPLRVVSIPFAAQCGEIEQNVARVVALIERAAQERIGLAVFPEACLTGGIEGWPMRRAQMKALATSVDGGPVQAVADAVERTGVAAGVGLIERAHNGELYSSYVVCLPDGQRHVHRKLQADGQPHIASGDGFTVFDLPGGWRIAVLVGGDNYLVENARMAALLGAGLLVSAHARADVAGDADETSAWLRRTLPARALDNGLFVVYSDQRHGAIVDPCGHVVAQRAAGEQMIPAELDPALIGTSPAHRWLATRRPELYARLAHEARPGSPSFEPRNASARGAVAVSFAVVRRGR